MRTNIEVTEEVSECNMEKGDIGFIDGYFQAPNGTPCVVVVIPKKGLIGWCKLSSNSLKFIDTKTVDTAQKDGWLVFFEDNDCDPVYFDNEEAARKFYELEKDSWSVHLFKRIEGTNPY